MKRTYQGMREKSKGKFEVIRREGVVGAGTADDG